MKIAPYVRPLPSLSVRSAAPAAEAAPQDTPVNQERLVDNSLKLTTIPGATRNERQVADTIKSQLGEMGLKAEEDDAGKKIRGNTGNLLVNIPGNVEGAPTLMFASHMDTVPFAVGCKPIVDGDVIHTDGSTALGGDCRAGCAELLEATKEILENNLPHGPIQLVFSVGEEGGLLGARQFDESKAKADFIYALDGFHPSDIYMQGRHLLAVPEEPPTAEEVHRGHEAMAHAPVVPPSSLRLTPEEKKILDFTADSIQDSDGSRSFTA